MSEVAIEVMAPGEAEADALAVPLAEDDASGDLGAGSVSERAQQQLRRLAADGDLKGDVGQTLLLHTDADEKAPRIVVAGVGKRADIDADAVRTAAAAATRRVGEAGRTVGWVLDESLPLSLEEQATAVVEGMVLGSYAPGRWKTGAKSEQRLEKIVLVTANRDGLDEVASQTGRVGKWVNAARDLANSPPNELTPEILAQRTAERAGPTVEVDVLDPSRIDELGMGALSAVGRGSANGPRLIVLRYEPA